MDIRKLEPCILVGSEQICVKSFSLLHHTATATNIPSLIIYIYIFFTDIQKKQPDDDCAPKTSSNSNSSQADIYYNEPNGSITQSLMSMPNTSGDISPAETGESSLPAQDGKMAVLADVGPCPFFLCK